MGPFRSQFDDLDSPDLHDLDHACVVGFVYCGPCIIVIVSYDAVPALAIACSK